LRENTDSAIATAATIALFNNRRVTETNAAANPLLVSRVSMNVETEESTPGQNILISYDTLQALNNGQTESANVAPSTTGDALDNQTANNDSQESGQNTGEIPSTSSPSPQVEEQQPESSEGALTIKLKFLDDTQRLATAWLNTTVGDLKRKYFSDVLTKGKVVRLIYQGQLLRDDSRSLESYGIRDQCVVHCHVGNRPYAQPNTAGANSTDGANINGTQQTPVTVRGNLGARIFATGIAWIDMLLYGIWSMVILLFNWIQTPENVADNADMPFARRIVHGIKRCLRIVFSSIIDVNAQSTAAADDPFSNRFNTGFLLGLLFTMKFITLWMFVVYFPQYTDPRGIFLLTLLTAVTASYFFFNRAVPTRLHQD
jgi:hypothetical protein